MACFKFVHTADVHLDSPFSGVGQVDTVLQKRLFNSTFKTFQNIIDLCIREKVDFLLIAGDLYNEVDSSLQAQLTCREQFKRLNNEGIQVFIAHGNHDHCAGWRADIDWPQCVHFFPAGEVESFPLIKGGEEVARIFGISYPVRAVTENYLPKFIEAHGLPGKGKPIDKQPVDKRTANQPYLIGVLHTNAGGNANYDNYAPCSIGELKDAGFDYWALGHIHTHQVLHSAKPVIVYPGTPQGRSPLEDGSKGCCLVEVSAAGETACQWIEVDDLRWQNLKLDIADLHRFEELLLQLERKIDALALERPDRGSIVSITITGRGELARELRRLGVVSDLLEQLRAEREGSTPFIWIASIKVTARTNFPLDALREEESLFGDYLRLTLRGQNLQENPELRELLLSLTAPLYKDRLLRKILTEPDDAMLQRIVRMSEELGIELFGLEVN